MPNGLHSSVHYLLIISIACFASFCVNYPPTHKASGEEKMFSCYKTAPLCMFQGGGGGGGGGQGWCFVF